MKQRPKQAIGLAALFALWLPAVDAPAGNGGVFELRGIPAGGRLKLTLTPKRAATKVFRVYSEPSHTFLLLVVDPRFHKSREGKAWLRKNAKGKPGATVTAKLPGGQPSVEVPAPPATDDRVNVWVLSSWEDGKQKDRRFESGKLDPAGYVITVDMMEAPAHP